MTPSLAKLLELLSLSAIVVLVFCGLQNACTKQDARAVLDVVLSAEQVACALAQAEMGTDENTISVICGVTDKVLPDLRRLLSGRRMSLALRDASAPEVGAPKCPERK